LSFTNKIIWIAWLQGWSHAPFLVKKCLSSWQLLNPDWQVRPIDLEQLRLYLDLPSFIGKSITAASFSDIARISLLHEYGGIWVDATLLCRKSLDDWIDPLITSGFFAFHRPGPDRPLSSWLLASTDAGHYIVDEWWSACLSYWSHRSRSFDYFWFHYLFEDLCLSNSRFNQEWQKVPKISADIPHRAQTLGLANEDLSSLELIQAEESPVLKLTHRHEQSLLERDCLLSWLIKGLPDPALPKPPLITASLPNDSPHLASLSVSTENLGDHIQIHACELLSKRLWNVPSIAIDRDNQIASLSGLSIEQSTTPIVINGWFKTNHSEWPPHPSLLPAFVGFHMRPHQCPTLLSEEAIRYYQQHQPIGCRDEWTCQLLTDHGVEAYISHCLTVTLPRRTAYAPFPSETFVVSRDTRICSFVPSEFGPYTFLSHYSGSNRFKSNMLQASRLLELYRSRAKLIITTLLHCALPAMAMGIPVIAVWPINTAEGRQSDRQRFSSLARLIKIHEPEELATTTNPVAASSYVREKLIALDSFARATSRWAMPIRPLEWQLAPSHHLAPP